jgi:DNA-directed RNA polymerase specialized sigma24 family protein
MDDRADLRSTLASFEGLVRATARMFAEQVHREEDDLAQELRLRVWRACETYDPQRSTQTLQRYVFGAVTNKIKDYKRDAAREATRRERCGLAFLHIESMQLGGNDNQDRQERFDSLFHYATHEQVFADVEHAPFTLPVGITYTERRVSALLVVGLARSEIASAIATSRHEIDECVRSLRAKLADWRPDAPVADPRLPSRPVGYTPADHALASQGAQQPA